MNFTLKQMRYFNAALRTGSIARASEDMNISQSSITAAIDLMEQTLGGALFRRIPAKGIVATQLGNDVGGLVAAFLEQARMFDSELMSLAGDPTGTLRLACYAPTAPYVLPPILQRIAAQYPDIRIELMEGDMASISDFMATGAVDVALTYNQGVSEQDSFHPLFEAAPWALLPKNWALAHARSVSLRDLADKPMVLLDLPKTKSYFVSLFEAQGLAPRIVHSTKSSSVLRGLVGGHFGYSILNICGPGDRDGRADYTALPISEPSFAPQFGVSYSPTVGQSSLVQAVLKIGTELTENGTFEPLLMPT